jgi:hypothetical protein
MTPLTQQLEDKKKELKQDKALGIGNRIYRLQAEIAILEQAIAEIKNIQSQQTSKEIVSSPELANADISNLLQKQRQEILEKIDKVIPTNWLDNKLSIFYGDKTFDERKIERLLLGIKQELKEQLNQPKTEK